MKTLLSTLILGAGLVLGGCGNKKEFTGRVSEISKDYKQTGWNLYLLTDNKDTLLVESNTLVNQFSEGDSIRVEYKFSKDKEEYWDKTENSGQLKEQGYSMNKLLSYQILKKYENKKSELEKYNLKNK